MPLIAVPEEGHLAGEQFGLGIKRRDEGSSDYAVSVHHGTYLYRIPVFEDAADLHVGEGQHFLTTGLFGGSRDHVIEGLAGERDDGPIRVNGTSAILVMA